jgi:hypothetical protein
MNFSSKFLFFKHFKKLNGLGIFKSNTIKTSKENLYYNYYLSYYSTDTIYSISMIYLLKCIYKIYPLIDLLLLKENRFLFINIDNEGGSGLTKFIYSIITKVKAYCTYDWGFGSLTNFYRIHLLFFLQSKKHLQNLPTIIILLRILDKQHYVIPETQRIGSLSLGPLNYEVSECIDYPIPMNVSLDYNYFFIKFILLLIHQNMSNSNFVRSYNKVLIK